MTLDEVSALLGVTATELRDWQRLGLIGQGDELGSEDVERARLIVFADRRGVPPADLARISGDQGDLLGPFVRWALRPGREVTVTPDEAAERAGIDRELLDRLWTAAGLRDQRHAFQEDVDALRLLKAAIDLGLPVDAVLQIVRVLADSSTRVAETMTRVFHLYVHEGFRAHGLSGETLMAATQSVADPMLDLVEPAVLYFHRKSWERANRDDMLLHLVEQTTTPSPVAGELHRTILFVDLSSFTSLTEAMGDAAAARIVERFSDMVRDTAAACDGQVVKQIGDEFMVVFATQTAAISFGVDIRQAATAERRFPALRIGAHAGTVLYRDGDYLGANVNLAARVTSAAARNQFLVTDALRSAVSRRDLDVVPVGRRDLKGVQEPVELFEVLAGDDPEGRHTDPVCGMELDEDSAEARLTWRDARLLFCSQRCLRLFLERSEG